MIRFLQPWWLLAVLPVLAGALLSLAAMQPPTYAMRFTNVEMPAYAGPEGLGWRGTSRPRRSLLCLLILATALARPAVAPASRWSGRR